MECESKSDISNNTGNWTQSKIIQIINIPGKRESKELRKKAILGAAHKLRKVLMYKYETFNMEIALLVAKIVNTE